MADQTTLAALLSETGTMFEIVDVGPCHTAAEAAQALGVPLGHVVKSLVCVADGTPVIALLTGDHTLSYQGLGRAVGADDVSLAPRRVVKNATGYDIGAVAPLGHPVQLALYADLAVKDLSVAFFGAGSHRHMLRLQPLDLERLCHVAWADLVTAPS
jgi:prolyl-tRNA editing enzyme YbaK/EbsC (Cys-tRNA(Pro) deacylase)